MDKLLIIKDIYKNIDSDNVENAVNACLRLARLGNDYLYTAIFLHELYPAKEVFYNILFDDIHHLKKEQQKVISDIS
ncbi:hypothetical protein [Marispirochaeta aestuarii]|uniref:hypothetical protein n=1 Tax=Marispirochaeta aestuarii TaxID=1963862 RepID=UPI0029C859B7|nr:hypothetical protein [Marispirochaeta aestuarii]